MPICQSEKQNQRRVDITQLSLELYLSSQIQSRRDLGPCRTQLAPLNWNAWERLPDIRDSCDPTGLPVKEYIESCLKA